MLIGRKESRAEQNRKAQQIFRRRREEKMKQLEMDSAALGPTRTRLSVAEARIEQLALVGSKYHNELTTGPRSKDHRGSGAS